MKTAAPADVQQHKHHIPTFSRMTYTKGQTNKQKQHDETAPSTARCITGSYAGTCCVHLQGPLARARSLRRIKVTFALTLAMKALRGSSGIALLFLYPWC
jgi:hypothetical protein